MNFVIIDLEWNGSYVKKVHGFFNEIIEIGAVKIGDDMREKDRFHAIIRPVVSKKLTKLVTNLTGIEDEELTDGTTFTGAMAAFRRWIGKEETVILTWSTTDLLVFLENYRYFCKTDTIPFMTAYADLQAYAQQCMDVPSNQQIGLSRAAEALGIDEEDVAHHRALDDSVLSGRILSKLYKRDAFAPFVYMADEKFYDRITFKNTYIIDPKNPLVKKEYLRFSCENCGKLLRFEGKWKHHNRALTALGQCDACGKKYTARVQIKVKYDGVDVKRKLVEKKPKETEEATNNEQETQ